MIINKNVSILIMILFLALILSCSHKRGQVQYGEKGVIKTGTGTLMCTPPNKRYTSEIQAHVKAELDKLIPDSNIELGIERKIVKLADYSQKGLDIDLILFRICEMSINRGFTNDQTNSLILKVIKLWNKEHTDNQKNVNQIIEGQSQIIEKQEAAISKADENLEISADIKELLQSMQQINKTSYDKLIKKFPRGYMLFAVDHSEIVVPSGSNLLKDYKLNISNAKVIKMTQNSVTFLFPDIYYVPRELKTINIKITVPRRLNKVSKYPIGIFPDNIYFEILEDKNNSIIYVVGFK